ncbi:MAG: glycine cleavage system aminomethyltransferase GcvT [Bacteroidetes bacterium]|nr:glycine cleavage system aminomethyltransferase GcvT [Bacteroidota bacterium]
MKHTALTHIHEGLGAKMVEYAGYNMPISYVSIKLEHQTVRNGVGVFDVSHMGEFIVKGPGSTELVQKLTTNDVEKLFTGKAQYACMTKESGGIIDDLLVYKLDENEYMLVVNGSNIQKDWDWVVAHNDENIELHNISDQTTLLAVQGPKAEATLQPLTEVNLAELKFYTFTKATFAGIDNVLISATGYTGSGGFEVYFENKHAEHIWNAIFESGAQFDINPIGLAARDTLRLEMGFCLYGNDIDETTTPLEAGLNRFTKFNNQYIGLDHLVSQKESGIQRKLIGFEMIDRGIARKDYEIVDEAGKKIGHVTSGTQAPSLDKAIGMGYVPVELAEPGQTIHIKIRDKILQAKVVPFPFYNPN